MVRGHSPTQPEERDKYEAPDFSVVAPTQRPPLPGGGERGNTETPISHIIFQILALKYWLQQLSSLSETTCCFTMALHQEAEQTFSCLSATQILCDNSNTSGRVFFPLSA